MNLFLMTSDILFLKPGQPPSMYYVVRLLVIVVVGYSRFVIVFFLLLLATNADPQKTSFLYFPIIFALQSW